MKKLNCFRAAKGVCFTACFCALLILSCGMKAQVDEIIINHGEGFAAEQEFLERLLLQPDFADKYGFRLIREEDAEQGEKTQAAGSPALFIEFAASWTQAEGIPVSRTWFAPREDPLAERAGTSFAACLDGSETLVPIGEIAPPYTGLLVDGLNAADENYPLVRYVSIRVRQAEDGAGKNLPEEKIAALETMLGEVPKPLMLDAPSILWICAAGDLMLGRGSEDILINEGAVGIFGQTAEYFRKSDINLVNLEGAVSSRGDKVVKSYNFRFNPRTVPFLKAAGINAALFANNHAFDYGETAFLDTLENLEKNEIAALGAGRDIAEAAAPFVFTTDNLEVRIFGFASFPRESTGWDGALASASEKKAGMFFAGRNSVERLRENFVQKEGVLNVLFFHGGHEWTWKPDAATRSLYAELARGGADLIIGTHPHTVQGFEWLEGKPVFWSLGNYVFAGMDGTDGGEEGLMIRLGYAGKTLVYFEPVPVRLTGPRSGLGPAEQLKRFYALSRSLPGFTLSDEKNADKNSF